MPHSQSDCIVSDRNGASRDVHVPRGRVWVYALIASLGFVYVISLSPGHVFAMDDFGAYVRHAINLAQGRAYAEINYVPNPKAMQISPANGYPPVYPLLLTPVYELFGLSFKAMKAVTILCFVVFLAVYARLMESTLPLRGRVCAIALVGCSPVFWQYRDYILSEFPYLLFSFLALLTIRESYKCLAPNLWDLRNALVVSFLICCAYGTRSIGIVLLPALALEDVSKFKRPSRFLLLVCSLTATLVLAETVLTASPRGYMEAFHFSLHTVLKNLLFYVKVLSYTWENGFSKTVQIAFAACFSGLAAVGFIHKLWKERSTEQFYVLSYLAVLVMWNAQIGKRGLMVLLPLYFAFGIEQLARILSNRTKSTQAAAWMILVVTVALTYGGDLIQQSRQAVPLNVLDSTATDVFSFLKANTKPSDIIVADAPRSFALMTGRTFACLGPRESSDSSWQFMEAIRAAFLVETSPDVRSWSISEKSGGRVTQVFQNKDFRVLRIDWGSSSRLLRTALASSEAR